MFWYGDTYIIQRNYNLIQYCREGVMNLTNIYGEVLNGKSPSDIRELVFRTPFIIFPRIVCNRKEILIN